MQLPARHKQMPQRSGPTSSSAAEHRTEVEEQVHRHYDRGAGEQQAGPGHPQPKKDGQPGQRQGRRQVSQGIHTQAGRSEGYPEEQQGGIK